MNESTPLSALDRSAILDHCGIVAAFSSSDTQFFQTGLRGLGILQTRGYDGAGFWAQHSGGRVYQYKGIGMVNEVFSPDIIQLFYHIEAKMWVFQIRYGTSGGFNPNNVQPLVAMHKQSGKPFVVAHNGQFSASKGSEKMKESDTVLFTRELAQMNGPSWDDRIIKALHERKGAWSLVIGTHDAMYIARDPHGFRPLVYGQIKDKRTGFTLCVVSSETSSLETMGVSHFYEVLPGSILKVTDDNIKTLVADSHCRRTICIFENIYIQHGASKSLLPREVDNDINVSPLVDDIRRKSGKILASESPLTKHDVDMVIGVPGTGIEGGMLFARALNLPYFQAITDRANSFVEQRTFMTADIDRIYEKVIDHFSFDAQTLLGRRVVLVDDSVVRGNITKGLIYLLKHKYSVISVHIRVLSPPIDKVCHLGVNTRSSGELIAARHRGDIESIRKELDADSLAYLSTEGLKEAMCGNSHMNGFCMGCMAGHLHPIDKYGAERHQLESEKRREPLYQPVRRNKTQ